jgi:hypothetical protein
MRSAPSPSPHPRPLSPEYWGEGSRNIAASVISFRLARRQETHQH